MILPLPSSPQSRPITQLVGMFEWLTKAPEHIASLRARPERSAKSVTLDSGGTANEPILLPPGRDRLEWRRDVTAPTPDALQRCETFLRDRLPGILRRYAVWKGLDRDLHADVVDDMRQEVVLDCLQHAQQVCDLPEPDLRTRWYRLVQRHHYRHWRDSRQQRLDAEISGACIPSPVDPRSILPRKEQQVVERLTQAAVFLSNGRLNLTQTADQLGTSATTLRAMRRGAAQRLGLGPVQLRFYRRRLAEALVQLTALRLRDRGVLRTFAAPTANLRATVCAERVRRLLRTVHSGHGPRINGLRVCGLHRDAVDGLDPRQLIDVAIQIAPAEVAVWLWAFETHLACAEVDRASRDLRCARDLGADLVRSLLARARLLEARDRSRAALNLLNRGLRRHRRDRRIHRSMTCLRQRLERPRRSVCRTRPGHNKTLR